MAEILTQPDVGEVDIGDLPRSRLEDMAAAGDEILECCRVLVRTSDNLVGELLRDAGTFYEWNHYPDGDVYDHETHSQYYYHAHPQELRSGEHGHFHTFLRPPGIPAGIGPAAVPDLEMPEDETDALCHLVGISMDELGVPIKLFTVNRWVTGEIWYTASDARAMLECFLIDHARPSWPVNRWISAMIRLYRPEIGALLDRRDVAVAAWRRDHPDSNVYEDRKLELTSVMDIDVDRQIARVRAALDAKN